MQKCYRVLSEAIELLPTEYISYTLNASHNANSEHLMSVRQKRTINRPHLVALIQYRLQEMGLQRKEIK